MWVFDLANAFWFITPVPTITNPPVTQIQQWIIQQCKSISGFKRINIVVIFKIIIHCIMTIGPLDPP